MSRIVVVWGSRSNDAVNEWMFVFVSNGTCVSACVTKSWSGREGSGRVVLRAC